jgi:hypothetical protein
MSSEIPEIDMGKFEDIAEIREYAEEAASRVIASLVHYRERNPNLHGLTDLMAEVIPNIQIAAGEMAALIPAVDYLCSDEELTVDDHVVLDHLLESLINSKDLVAMLHSGLCKIEEIWSNHDLEKLGAPEV